MDMHLVFEWYGSRWGNPIFWRGISHDPYIGYEQLTETSSAVLPYGDPGSPTEGLPEFIVHRTDGGFIPAPENLNEMLVMAIKTMMPSVKGELSLINSLLELKDLKRSVSSATAFLRSASYRRLLTVGRWKAIKPFTLLQWLRSVPGGYLEWSFNLRPLISDIRGIYLALSQAEKRINALITRSARAQNRHFRYIWTEFQNSNDVSVSGWWGVPDPLNSSQTINAERTVTYEPSEFHAQMKYNYNYASYQVEHARLLALLDALGVNLNPAIIWNAIPWSFVVDWVFGVSRWLDQFKMANMEPMINIQEFLWSVKRERSSVVTKGVNFDHSGLFLSSTQLPRSVQTAYRRWVGFPAVSSFTTSGVSLKEFTLGAALVLSQRRRRHHRGR
jgi:hypothetical protein